MLINLKHFDGLAFSNEYVFNARDPELFIFRDTKTPKVFQWCKLERRF